MALTREWCTEEIVESFVKGASGECALVLVS